MFYTPPVLRQSANEVAVWHIRYNSKNVVDNTSHRESFMKFQVQDAHTQ